MAATALRLRSDEHLVALFRRGREDAFEALHERHRRRLHALAARALRSHGGDPEGIVQEAFVRAHRALREPDHPRELRPWLQRVVRNLCVDELRRARLTAAGLEDGDRAGASEDVFTTLSRRHELRRLIEDLAELPDQQRSALLLRELDGLSHDEVASVLDVSPAASRQLVARARHGLVATAAARDADCAAIRPLLLAAHDERRRPSEHALRHVRGCDACRSYRDALKATRSRLRALVPPLGAGPLAGLLQAVGGGGAAAGAGGGAKLLAATCCAALLAAGGAGAWVAGHHQVIRHRAPATEAGGKLLVGRPIRTGTHLPRSVAIATVTVALPAGERHEVKRSVRVSCPPGMRAAGLATPRLQDGTAATGDYAMYQYSDADMDALAHGGRRTAMIRYAAARNLSAPVVVQVGTLCKRRTG